MFSCRRDLLSVAYFVEFFPYRTLLIRVKLGVQDVSLYTYVWRPSKAMLDLSKVYMPPSASPC